MMELNAQRDDGEIVARAIVVALGGQRFVIPELPRRANREFKASLADEITHGFASLDGAGNDWSAVIGAFATTADLQLRLLRKYDATGTLPDDDWLDGHATDGEILDAFKRVLGAVFPIEAELVKAVGWAPLIGQLVPLLGQTNSAKSPNGSQLSTAGAPTTSKKR